MGVVEALPSINHDVEFKAIWKALRALRAGDVSVRLPVDWPESAANVASEFNELAGQFERMSHEIRAIERDSSSLRVGSKKRLSQRI